MTCPMSQLHHPAGRCFCSGCIDRQQYASVLVSLRSVESVVRDQVYHGCYAPAPILWLST